MARSQGIYDHISILLTHVPPVCFMITDYLISDRFDYGDRFWDIKSSTSPVSAAQRSANIRRRPSRWSRAGWPVWKSVPKRPGKPDSLCWDTRDETLCLMHTCTALKRVLVHEYHREGCVCIIKSFISSIKATVSARIRRENVKKTVMLCKLSLDHKHSLFFIKHELFCMCNCFNKYCFLQKCLTFVVGKHKSPFTRVIACNSSVIVFYYCWIINPR